jgi:hypothetical protein
LSGSPPASSSEPAGVHPVIIRTLLDKLPIDMDSGPGPTTTLKVTGGRLVVLVIVVGGIERAEPPWTKVKVLGLALGIRHPLRGTLVNLGLVLIMRRREGLALVGIIVLVLDVVNRRRMEASFGESAVSLQCAWDVGESVHGGDMDRFEPGGGSEVFLLSGVRRNRLETRWQANSAYDEA